MKKALFLDRDGIINVDKGYLHRIEDVEFVDGITSLLKTAQELGYGLYVITNQSGVDRGYYTEEDVLRLHEWMTAQFKADGVHIIEFFHCPHHPEHTGECDCRKPGPGMILAAAAKYDINLSKSVIIGDKESDIMAGFNAGLYKKILVSSRYVTNPVPHADCTVSTLKEAEDYLRGCS